MSSRLCCYKQQQHSKLMAQFVFKVSAFRFNARTKTCAPLPDCHVNNALIQFCLSQAVRIYDVPDPPFSDIACSIMSCLAVGIFLLKNSIVTKFCHLVLGSPVIVPQHVVLLIDVRCKHFYVEDGGICYLCEIVVHEINVVCVCVSYFSQVLHELIFSIDQLQFCACIAIVFAVDRMVLRSGPN